MRRIGPHLSQCETDRPMNSIHYIAVWTDSGSLVGCNHVHQTVTSAVACINTAGGFVLAVGTSLRELTPAEQEEFKTATYGRDLDAKTTHQLRACFDWIPVNLASPGA